MPSENTIVMQSGKYAGLPPSKLESTYIVHTLENTKLIEELRHALLTELHKRFFNNIPKS